jgi:hypothetical protein
MKQTAWLGYCLFWEALPYVLRISSWSALSGDEAGHSLLRVTVRADWDVSREEEVQFYFASLLTEQSEDSHPFFRPETGDLDLKPGDKIVFSTPYREDRLTGDITAGSRSDDVSVMLKTPNILLLGFPGFNRHFDPGEPTANIYDLVNLAKSMVYFAALRTQLQRIWQQFEAKTG